MNTRASRRQFLRNTCLTTAGLFIVNPRLRAADSTAANSKLNIGVIGVAGRGGDNLRGVSSQNIVALCDIDDNLLSAAARNFPSAKTYNDFRLLLENKEIEAVVVSTPDHIHAVAAAAALNSGRHVYCEKPLTRTVSEARFITDLARRQKRVTQLGTQIHAENNYRRVVELIQSDVIGPVREVHVWVNVSYGNKERPQEGRPVPPNIHYDLWLGPVESRPYHPEYLPFAWRNWWAFGGGALADFGCHYMDLPFWALDLRYPLSIEPLDGPPVHPESTPAWAIVRYQFPARGEKPPVQLTWYHGGKRPEMLSTVLSGEEMNRWKSGILFVGQKGMVISGYGNHMLLPEKQFENFVRPQQFIKNSIGHHKEWFEACKNGGPTTCNFDYSGPLTETSLLGNVAFRVSKKLEWDPAKLVAVNCPEATQYIQHQYRPGWKLG